MTETITKDDLAEIIAAATQSSHKAAGQALDDVLDKIAATLAQGAEVRLYGFGTFTRGKRAAGTGRNPQTGAPVDYPDSYRAKFTQGKRLKDRLAMPAAHQATPRAAE